MNKRVICEELRVKGETQLIINNTYTLYTLSRCGWLEDFDIDCSTTAMNDQPTYTAKVNTTINVWERLYSYCVRKHLYPITVYNDCTKYNARPFKLRLYEENQKKLQYDLYYDSGYITLRDYTGFKYDLSGE
jgi:hypothetical protein